MLNEGRDLIDAFAFAQIGEHERPLPPHPLGVALHHFERGADVGREVDLVDDEEIGAGDAGAALPRDLLAGGDVDHVEGEVGELRREGGGEIVAAGFDQHQIEIGKLGAHLRDGGEIDGGILADRGVRAAAGLHAHDALRGQRAGADQIAHPTWCRCRW